MTLQQLTMFAAVARLRSLTRASEELGKSEPTLSRYLKSMQEQHGSQLFRRASKGVVLTAEGQAFLRRVVRILNLVTALENSAKSVAPKATSQVLRVGGTFSPSTVLLPKLMARMRQRYPRGEFAIRTKTSDQLERQLLHGQLDLAVSARMPPSAELESELFRDEKIALFVSASHRLAKRANVQLRELLKEPLVLRGGQGGSGITDQAIEQLRADGADVRIGLYCDGPTSIKAAVREKFGVGVVLADSIKAEVASGEFKILKVPGLDLVGQSYVVYSKKRPLPPLAQELLEMLRDERAKLDRKTRSNRSSASRGSHRSKRKLGGLVAVLAG